MKIKNIFQLICSLAFLSVASLTAQDISALSSTSSAPVHVGCKNRYKIGTANDPVTAREYFSFLDTKDEENDPLNYYDSSFMQTADSLTLPPRACIEYTQEIVTPNRFMLRKGHENVIIDGLQSQAAQIAFNSWREENPASPELCVYLNDQITGNNEDADALKSKYPHSSVFQQLDEYAENYNAYSQSRWFEIIDESDKAYDGKRHYGFNFMTDSSAINSFLFFKDLHCSHFASGENNKVHGYFNMINCDLFGVDERGHALLQRGSNRSFPAIPVAGAEYFRPTSIEGKTPNTNYLKEKSIDAGDAMDLEHLQFGISANK